VAAAAEAATAAAAYKRFQLRRHRLVSLTQNGDKRLGVARILLCEERKRLAVRSCAPGAADAVHIVFRRVGEIELRKGARAALDTTQAEDSDQDAR
jgi:hypothetical protein